MTLVSCFESSRESSELLEGYLKQLKRLIPFKWNPILIRKSPNERPSQLLKEEEAFLEAHKDFWICDEGGKSSPSKEFTSWLFKEPRHLVIGPAVGFHAQFKKKALGSLSLSSFTLTHRTAQLVLIEQIYRAACIERNHPFVK